MAKILNKIKEKFKETPLVPTYGEMAANPTTPPTVQAPDKNGKIGDKIFAGIQNIGSMLGFNQGAQNSGTPGVQNGNTPEASAPSAQPSTQTSTHPDYYNQAINDINKAKEDALLYAKNAKEQAYEQAAINRESDMIKAANDYERAKAGYGAKAEMLASMGLTGSGYSDYLEAQAYAANRSDVQNAIAREAEAKRLADNQYDEMSYAANSEANKLTAETKLAGATYKEGIFNDILSKVQNGTYTQEEAENLAKLYGIEGEQFNAITNASNSYKSKEAEAEYNTIIDNISADPDYYNEAYLDKLATDGRISAKQAQDAKEHIKEVKKENVVTNVKQYIDSGDAGSAVSALESAYNNGTIDKDTYQAEYFKVGLSNYGNISVREIPDAIKDIDSLVDEGKISKSDGESLKKYAFEKSGGKVANSSSVKYVSGATYTITIGNVTYDNIPTFSAPDEMKNLLKSIYGNTDGTVVDYNGKVYVYSRKAGWLRIHRDEYSDLSKEIKKHAKESKIPTHSK